MMVPVKTGIALQLATPLCLGKHSGTEGWNEIQCLLVAKNV